MPEREYHKAHVIRKYKPKKKKLLCQEGLADHKNSKAQHYVSLMFQRLIGRDNQSTSGIRNLEYPNLEQLY